MATEAQLEAVRQRANQEALDAIEQTEEKTIASEKADDAENPTEDVTFDDQDAKRDFRYPLDLSPNFPARIIFKAIKIEGIDILESTGIKKFAQENFGIDLNFPTPEAKADETTSQEEKKRVVEDSNKKPAAQVSYENNTGGVELGKVTLPLQSVLKYGDVVQYGSAKLGLIGGGAEALALGQSFEGATNNAGQLTSAGTAMAAKLIAENAGAIAGAGIGLIPGAGGVASAVVGAAAGANLGEGLGGAVASATRIASAPNERTLFESVKIREFDFDFTMVANSRAEAEQVKNIIKFFRQELYPEKIPIGATGIPLAYKFPNVFEIEVKNKFQENPGFKIQRCYLQNVTTAFNNTATGMFDDGSFVEAQISLNFVEIVALDKGKVRRGY